MAGENLTGNYRVRATRPAMDESRRLFAHVKHRMEIRRHALKLRYWPQKNPVDNAGSVLDLDWSWVMALRSNAPGVGELRIDQIGGLNNLRIIFFVGDASVRDPMPLIWVLRLMQKKRDDFTAHDLSIFRARRLLVLETFYRL